MLGWQWLIGPGFTLAIETGWQIAASSSSAFDIKADGVGAQEKEILEQQKDYVDAKKKVEEDILEQYQGESLPQISIGIGWML